MSVAVSKTRLPSAIHARLNAVRYRHAMVLAARSLLIAAALFVALLLISMLVDWAFPFLPTWARFGLKFTTLGAAVIGLFATGLTPIRKALGWERVAGAIDEGTPVLEERLSTVASLSIRDAASQTDLERAMARQVTSEAIALQRVVVPAKIASPASPQIPLICAGAATLVLALWLVINPAQVNLLLHRFWSPTSHRTATQISSAAGDQFVPRGEKIALIGELTGVPRSSATLVLTDPEGKEEHITVKPGENADGSFQHSLRVEENTSFRWISGDGRSPVHRLQVIDYPQAEEIEFDVEFPEYIDRLPVQRDRLPRRVKVPQHSQLSIAIRPDMELESLQLTIKTRLDSDSASKPTEETVTLERQTDGWYRFAMPLTEDVVLQATLTSPHGLQNQTRLLSKINVIADQAPVARIISPSEETAIAFDEQIEVQYEAHDDHGIATAELVVYDEQQTDEDGNPKVLATEQIDLGDERFSKHVSGKAVLDLEKLGIAPDSEISYAIRVTDNREETSEVATPEPAADGSAADVEATNQRAGTSEGKASDEPNAEQDVESEGGDSAASKSMERRTGSPTYEEQDNRDGEGDSSDENASQENAISDAADSEESSSTERDSMSTEDTSVAGTNEDESSQENGETQDAAVTDANATTADPEAKASASNSDTTPEPKPNTAANANPSNSASANTQSNNAPQPNGSSQSASNQPVTPPTPDAQQPDQQPQPEASAVAQLPRDIPLKMQRSPSGQNTTSRRRRVQVTDRLTAIAEAEDLPGEDREIRESVVEIDRMLKTIEAGLRNLVNHKIADSDRGEQFRRMDKSLKNVETYVAELRTATRDNQFAFVGLQMVDITRTHVTPARDRVFQATQRPGASDPDATAALRSIVRARELLAALLKRYDEVVRERRLQRRIDESITIYEVYEQKRRLLMREARQNLNPMERKMAIVEVDQEYLDRLAEVVRLRREMMDELASMLGDDPRLLSRYLDLIKRQGKSLRDQLTEISQRQYDLVEETLGWIQIDPTQQQDYWTILAELRLPLATDLAKDTAQMAERIEKQLPFEVDANDPLASELLKTSKQLVELTRQASFDAEKTVMEPLPSSDVKEDAQAKQRRSMVAEADRLVPLFDRLSATLDQLQFDNAELDSVADYVEPRLLEAQAVRDLAESWRLVARAFATGKYAAIVQSEQHQLAIDTQLLRVEMLGMKQELDDQFQQLADTSLPDEIGDMIEQLHAQMEAITFNQIASAIRAGREDLETCSGQQQLASERLEAAEKLFDRIRRAVVEELDQYDPEDPNIADLEDPTLDEFLAQLEREPNIERQLGIPQRQRNLRVFTDTLVARQGGGSSLNMSARAAAARAREATRRKRKDGPSQKPDPEQSSKEEQQQREEDRKVQQMLERSLAEIKRRRDAAETSDEERHQLSKLAEDIETAMNGDESGNAERARWNQLVKSDEARQLLSAIADGRTFDGGQWNMLLSELDDGLWQVRGKRPPEAYRQAIEQYQDQLRELTGEE